AFRIPAFVHRMLVTPEVHRIHHSIDARQGNSNYSTVFPIWDLLFGSYTDPRRVKARQTGIDRDPIPRRFLTELWSPIAWRRLSRASLRQPCCPDTRDCPGARRTDRGSPDHRGRA